MFSLRTRKPSTEPPPDHEPAQLPDPEEAKLALVASIENRARGEQIAAELRQLVREFRTAAEELAQTITKTTNMETR